MELELIQIDAEDKMQTALDTYSSNISKISTGRANPGILSSIKVIYYDSPSPINEIASITVPEPRQLLIKPYDMSVTADIASAINKTDIGINAVDEGDKIRMTFPELTTDRRKELVKSLAKYTEQAKISIRAARQDANKYLKANELPEDDERHELEEIQKLTDKYIGKVDQITKEKEKDLMTI